MKKFRSVPAVITLLAGFVTSVFMIANKISIVAFLWTLALVMTGFYIVGIILRVILNKVFEDKTEDGESEETGEEDGTEDNENPKEDEAEEVKEA